MVICILGQNFIAQIKESSVRKAVCEFISKINIKLIILAVT